MAYIQVCPQTAKGMEFYAIKTPVAGLAGKWTDLNFHRFVDGSQKEEADVTRIPFRRIGDYKVTATWKFDEEDADPDVALNGEGEHLKWIETISWKDLNDGWWRYDGILHAILPDNGLFEVYTKAACQLVKASFVNEYLA